MQPRGPDIVDIRLPKPKPADQGGRLSDYVSAIAICAAFVLALWFLMLAFR